MVAEDIIKEADYFRVVVRHDFFPSCKVTDIVVLEFAELTLRDGDFFKNWRPIRTIVHHDMNYARAFAIHLFNEIIREY